MITLFAEKENQNTLQALVIYTKSHYHSVLWFSHANLSKETSVQNFYLGKSMLNWKGNKYFYENF